MVWILQDAAVEPFAHFQLKYQWFCNMQDTVVNPLLIVWDLRGGDVVKPFTYVSNEILMVLNFQEAAVKPYTHFSNEILIFRLCFH